MGITWIHQINTDFDLVRTYMCTPYADWFNRGIWQLLTGYVGKGHLAKANGGCPFGPHPEATWHNLSVYVAGIFHASVSFLELRVRLCERVSLCAGRLRGQLGFQQPTSSPRQLQPYWFSQPDVGSPLSGTGGWDCGAQFGAGVPHLSRGISQLRYLFWYLWFTPGCGSSPALHLCPSY